MNKTSQIRAKRKVGISRTSSNKKRPDSSLEGLKNKINQVIGLYDAGEPSLGRKRYRYGQANKHTAEELKIKKDATVSFLKDREELYEQNIVMKKQTNKLQEELSLLKGKIELTKKQNRKRDKKLAMEFEKEMYWSGNKTHLVSGIKFQYQQLKESYSQKCKQNQQLKLQLTKTRLPELLLYNEALEGENKRLKDFLQQRKTQILYDSIPKIQQKLKETRQSLKKVKNEVNERDKKIMFLEKLIIEKQNKQYHAIKRVKKSQKEKQKLNEIIQQLNKRLSSYEQDKQDQINEFREDYESKIQKLKSTHISELHQKDFTIEKLNLHIKELDSAITDLQISNAMNPTSKIDLNNLVQVRETRMNVPIISQSIQFSQKPAPILFGSTLSKVVKEVQQINQEPRKQKTADQPHSQHSTRVRKLQMMEIQHIIQYIQYRLIKHNIAQDSIKSYLDYDILSILGNQSSQEWDEEYVSMKEVKKVLLNEPFCLTEEDALLLSRYIVEDAQGEYIYCDELNEQKRQVAKSILKSLLWEYELCSVEVRQEYKEFVLKYKENIASALKTICPSGKVSAKKLIEVIDGLGLGATPPLKQYIIANLAVVSVNLRQLDYTTIYHTQ